MKPPYDNQAIVESYLKQKPKKASNQQYRLWLHIVVTEGMTSKITCAPNLPDNDEFVPKYWWIIHNPAEATGLFPELV